MWIPHDLSDALFELKTFGGLGYGCAAHAGGDFFGGQGNTSF
jgi:hypothetical protein